MSQLSYVSDGFSWIESTTTTTTSTNNNSSNSSNETEDLTAVVDSIIARFARSSSNNYYATGAAVQSGPNPFPGRSRRGSADRLSIDAVDGSFVPVGSAAGAHGASDRHRRTGTNTTTSTGTGKPLMKLLAQGRKEDYKLLTLRDKLTNLQKEITLFYDTHKHQSNSTNTTQTPNNTSSSSSSSSNNKEEVLLNLEIAQKWRLIAREMLKLPDSVFRTAPSIEAQSAVQTCMTILVECEYFFGCNLGAYDCDWMEFAEIQSVR